MLDSTLEKLIVSAFLREESFFAQYSSIIDDTMFATSSCKICINVYIDYVRKYNELPNQEEMYSDLGRYCTRYGIDDTMKQRAIETLQECYKLNYNIDYVRDHFIKFATTNKLTDAIIDAAKVIKEKGEYLSDRDYESIHESIEKAITIKARDTEGVMFSEVADNPLEFMQTQNRYDKDAVVKTGIATFDTAHMAGGPLPGEMYVVSAPPGRGKSTLLVNIGASALLQGKDVVHIFVGDNTEADGVLRYCARLTGVPLSQIMLNSSKYIESWNYLKENFTLGNLIIGSYPIDGPTISDIRSFITKNIIRRGINPSIFIIDYIDNCRRSDSMNSYEALGELYKKMKNICEELKLIGWTASQPKVSEWDTGDVAGLSSLAESSMKQHIVDGIITLNKNSDTSYQMYIPKLRRGRSDFTIDLLIDYERMFCKENLVTRGLPVQNSSNNTIATMSTYNTNQETRIPKNTMFSEDDGDKV